MARFPREDVDALASNPTSSPRRDSSGTTMENDGLLHHVHPLVRECFSSVRSACRRRIRWRKTIFGSPSALVSALPADHRSPWNAWRLSPTSQSAIHTSVHPFLKQRFGVMEAEHQTGSGAEPGSGDLKSMFDLPETGLVANAAVWHPRGR